MTLENKSLKDNQMYLQDAKEEAYSKIQDLESQLETQSFIPLYFDSSME
jgi:hypothetical protein